MKAHLISGLLFGCLAALGTVAGCVVDTTPQAEDEAIASQEEALLMRAGDVFTVRPDLRRCMAPLCGGFWIKEVNAPLVAERYVSFLDFSKSGLDPRTIALVEATPARELVLRGWLGHPDARFHTRPLMVSEAYRGLPRVEKAAGDHFYRVHDRTPPIMCFAAPCNNLIASEINTAEREAVTSLDVERALLPRVDGSWVADRAIHHGAIVAGHVRDGHEYPAGPEQVLDVSQVWIRLPVLTMCPMRPHVICEAPLRATYERTPDRCLIFQGCAYRDGCMMDVRPTCPDGYMATAWPSDGPECVTIACDPAFIVH